MARIADEACDVQRRCALLCDLLGVNAHGVMRSVMPKGVEYWLGDGSTASSHDRSVVRARVARICAAGSCPDADDGTSVYRRVPTQPVSCACARAGGMQCTSDV